MEFTIIKADAFITTNWSGGTTNQLFIFPPTAEYQKRNFDFRLSTAKVESEKSEFTLLPGVSRKIMILNGEIEIYHLNQYRKKLSKFEIDVFEGDWKTTSIGKCTDFNLMTTNKTAGEIKAVVLAKTQSLDYLIQNTLDYLFVYLFKGKSSVEVSKKKQILEQGDLLVLKKPINSNLCFKATENSELIFTKINVSSAE